jgi:perosamine synthetase
MSNTSYKKSDLALYGGTPVREKLLPYGKQFVDQKDVNAVIDVLQSDWLTTGPMIVKFEEAFSKQVGAAHGVAVSSGTAGLHCAVYVAGIEPGDDENTRPIIFMTTANCIR